MHAATSDRGGSWRLPPDETLQVQDPKQKDDEAYESEGHNWRSIILSLLVIGFVIAGIITAIYLLGYVDELLYWSGRRMILDEYLQGDLTPHRLQPAWVTTSKYVFQSDDGGLVVWDTATNSVSTLVTNHTLRQLNVKGYQCSYDLRYVLFRHNVKKVQDPKQKDDEAYESEGHNWRSIILSLLVIGFVIAGIITAIYLLGYVDELLYWSGRRMILDEYLQGDLTPHRLQPAWVTTSKYVFQSDDGGLVVWDTATNSVSTLVTNHTLRQLNVKGYQCSYDLRYVLFRHNVKKKHIQNVKMILK